MVKFDTILKRYKNLGYESLNLNDEIEIEGIINWLYKKYNIFIYTTYTDIISQKCYSKHIKNISFFASHRVYYCGLESNHTIYSEFSFDNPFDAKLSAIKDVYLSIKNGNNILGNNKK